MKERIAELRRKRAALVAEMKAIVAKDDSDDVTMSEDDKNRFDEIKDSIDNHDQRIGRLEDMVSAEGDEVDDNKTFADSVQKNNVLIINKKNRKNEAKGTMAARFVIGAGMMGKQGRDAGVQYVRDALDDGDVAKALNATGTSAAGGLLIPQDYRQEIIDLLWSEAVVRAAGPKVIPLPLGQITMPRLSAASTATWIGEQTDISVSQPVVDQIVMQAKKLAGIVPVQNDLIRRSPLAVESIVREQMVQQLAVAEDQAFLTSQGSGFTPKGLTAWALASNVSNVLVEPSLSVVNQVLSAAELDLRFNNVPTRSARWIMPENVRSYLNTLTDSVGRYFFREQLDAGKLFGYPISTTNNLASNLLTNGTPLTTTLTTTVTAQTTLVVGSTAGMQPGMNLSGTGITAVTTVVSVTDATHVVVSPAVTMTSGATITSSYVTSNLILVAMDQVLLGDTLEMYADSSDVASYFDGTNTVSAYQRDQTVFRIIEEVDLNVQHPAAISVTNVFNWIPSFATPQSAITFATQTATYPPSPSLSATPV